MPEGDTIFRTARTLHRALAGQIVTRFESVFPRLTRIHDDHPITGRTVQSVTSRGKHLLMEFSGDLTLHTHLRMNGSWHIYRAGERWQRPLRDMRIVVGTEQFVAVAFTVQVAELLSSRDLERHPQLRQLGPDLAQPSDSTRSERSPLDRANVASRIRSRGREPIGDVLLNQRGAAGIGNVLKSEILFVSAINPFKPAADLSDVAIERLLDAAQKLFAMNIAETGRTVEGEIGRRTTGSLDPNAKLWVYGRGGKPCRRCGTKIEAKKTGLDARLTYWCPRCQPA